MVGDALSKLYALGLANRRSRIDNCQLIATLFPSDHFHFGILQVSFVLVVGIPSLYLS